MSNRKTRHIGIIPDGARRWSRREETELAEAYRISFRRLGALVALLCDRNVGEITIYLLSAENLNRRSEELTALYEAFSSLREAFDMLCLQGRHLDIRLVGSVEQLPAVPRRELESCAGWSPFPPQKGHREGTTRVNLLVAYDAWTELRNLFVERGAIASPDDLPISTPVEAILRSGGGALLSGFLPVQSRYAHLVTFPDLFNDLSPASLIAALDDIDRLTHLHGR